MGKVPDSIGRVVYIGGPDVTAVDPCPPGGLLTVGGPVLEDTIASTVKIVAGTTVCSVSAAVVINTPADPTRARAYPEVGTPAVLGTRPVY